MTSVRCSWSPKDRAKGSTPSSGSSVPDLAARWWKPSTHDEVPPAASSSASASCARELARGRLWDARGRRLHLPRSLRDPQGECAGRVPGRAALRACVLRAGRRADIERGDLAAAHRPRVRRWDVPGVPAHRLMTRRPVTLLVNPISGGKPGSGPPLDEDPSRLTSEALEAALRQRGLEVETHVLAEADDPAALARSAAAAGRDVVVAGGDGTVSLAASALVSEPKAALGILAMGSFNNMARGFDVPSTLDAALDAISVGKTTAMDCGWVVRDGEGGRPFFEAAGVGLDALGFLAVEIAGRRGWRAALRALWRGLRMRRTPMRITIDDRTYSTGSPAVTVSNGPYH